ncbi:hypothetical protein [Streptomyces albireticuli]|nr:hypothetical protein [Streptomyces albireticuli]MCD9143201.1 hypothetical protein [Streptomyces albireticuli]MCD9163643.1 hypothetical protein [Streptomyces albireticuli]MCD9191318.1 hypothetical protein [Streptomyces albireticuli]
MSAGQSPYQGPRTLRAAMFAVVCVLLAALGHAVMSGTTVPWWAVVVALSGTGSAAWFLAGRERGPLLITLATVGAQTALHHFFALAQNVAANAARAARLGLDGDFPLPGGMSGMSGMGGMGDMGGMGNMGGGGHSMSAMPMSPDMAGMPMDHSMGMAGMSGHDMSMHAGHGALAMWSAHVVVALICGIWLAGGEQAAFRLGRTLRTRLFAPLLVLFRDVPTRQGPPRIRADRTRAAQRLRQLLYAHVLATRGPPARPVAAAV